MLVISRQRFAGFFVASLTAILCSTLYGLRPTPAVAQGGLEMWNKECKKLLKQYAEKPRHKAFAVSTASSSRAKQSCGVAWGATSKKQAEVDAVRLCNSERAGACWVVRSE
jgi:hypothetical protein